MDIFITDIKTEYDDVCCCVGNREARERVITGYSVEFILNHGIECKIHIDGNSCDGCKEKIREYIKDKIYEK